MTYEGQRSVRTDPASLEIRERARAQRIPTIWDRYAALGSQCRVGELGICCTICHLGPCNLGLPGSKRPQVGVCGAGIDTVAARRLARDMAAGSAAHSDHGRGVAHLLLLAARGEAPGYGVRDERKLRALATELGVAQDGRPVNEVAQEVALACLAQFGRQEGPVAFARRAPARQQEIWQRLGIIPRGIDREIVEVMHRTNMGVDNDYRSIVLAGMRSALADGWGGSMIATDLQDVLFGTPRPLRAQMNLGVLRADQVNILVHGHEPQLAEAVADAAGDPELLAQARALGASGINVAGICCTANEILMRRGIPLAGNFLQQELALVTGAVEAFLVDVQCIMPGLVDVASCFHTELIATSRQARFPGMVHIELSEDRAPEVARQIVARAVANYARRDPGRVVIPDHKMDVVAGFTTESITHILGGRYRGGWRPLNDGIIAGRIRGVVGVVGCDSPKQVQDQGHLDLVYELLARDVLVVQTGCSAIACGKAGLLQPEAAFRHAGRGLREICEATGIPPVLHTGSCVDNSRILTACMEMVKEGGIGRSFDELPVAAAAPGWWSEKAIAIGFYAVASGIFTVLGSPFNILGSEALTHFVTEELEGLVGGKFAFEPDPAKAAQLIVAHLDRKRQALKLRPMMYEAVPVGA
ncbi:MAG: anaerobic carbon-monoxide dehydrogenase catalytic subunit [Armatimonadota bacterium]|nr:anaerobic carbon-monoxide dehydrogenase catalytic subunit [Armatimonadota bacterium]MDR7426594.1 anaerobic carbon-monoxide dehydrogenase catalytic subunit [Armatimonadota bacterium]MDR7463693.1 anaerobic carbon-monoxide dehydrogenase catalytic subunit [Armatimonadota bacterium]MDR7468614.1 anaerobic carbon-monoxide dehydrogenase catalytic subunit [Armatimonadota bacterium]MDR7473737.1 anaerobic carbon-monoxide dehydrogenase catalytic subunit [Armatimonadota bacterium]